MKSIRTLLVFVATVAVVVSGNPVRAHQESTLPSSLLREIDTLSPGLVNRISSAVDGESVVANVEAMKFDPSLDSANELFEENKERALFQSAERISHKVDDAPLELNANGVTLATEAENFLDAAAEEPNFIQTKDSVIPELNEVASLESILERAHTHAQEMELGLIEKDAELDSALVEADADVPADLLTKKDKSARKNKNVVKAGKKPTGHKKVIVEKKKTRFLPPAIVAEEPQLIARKYCVFRDPSTDRCRRRCTRCMHPDRAVPRHAHYRRRYCIARDAAQTCTRRCRTCRHPEREIRRWGRPEYYPSAEVRRPRRVILGHRIVRRVVPFGVVRRRRIIRLPRRGGRFVRPEYRQEPRRLHRRRVLVNTPNGPAYVVYVRKGSRAARRHRRFRARRGLRAFRRRRNIDHHRFTVARSSPRITAAVQRAFGRARRAFLLKHAAPAAPKLPRSVANSSQRLKALLKQLRQAQIHHHTVASNELGRLAHFQTAKAYRHLRALRRHKKAFLRAAKVAKKALAAAQKHRALQKKNVEHYRKVHPNKFKSRSGQSTWLLARAGDGRRVHLQYHHPTGTLIRHFHRHNIHRPIRVRIVRLRRAYVRLCRLQRRVERRYRRKSADLSDQDARLFIYEKNKIRSKKRAIKSEIHRLYAKDARAYEEGKTRFETGASWLRNQEGYESALSDAATARRAARRLKFARKIAKKLAAGSTKAKKAAKKSKKNAKKNAKKHRFAEVSAEKSIFSPVEGLDFNQSPVMQHLLKTLHEEHLL